MITSGEPGKAPPNPHTERLRAFCDNGAPDYDVVAHGLTYGDLRGVLRERDELAEKLAIAMRTIDAQAHAPSPEGVRHTETIRLLTAACEGQRAVSDHLQAALNNVFAAFERLHTRIHRDLPGDGSELPPPEDEFWARQLDDLVAFADELYHPLVNIPTAPTRHFSPGYDGEKPDPHGPFAACAMPACVTSRAQHEAADRIQDLPHEILRDREDIPVDAEPTEWLIWSHEHGAWWAPRSLGYTSDLTGAGTYEADYARNICRAANARPDWPGGMPPEVAIPYTDDPQTAATAIRTATQHWTTDRSAAPTSTGRETTP